MPARSTDSTSRSPSANRPTTPMRATWLPATNCDVPFDVPDAPTVAEGDLSALDVSTADDAVTVSGDGFEYVLDTDAGTFSAMNYGGTNVVDRGPQFNAWRAPIMNEVQRWGSEQASSWYAAGSERPHAVGGRRVRRAGVRLARPNRRGRLRPRCAAEAYRDDARRERDRKRRHAHGRPENRPRKERVGGAVRRRRRLRRCRVPRWRSTSRVRGSPSASRSTASKRAVITRSSPRATTSTALKINGDRFSFFIYDETWIAVNDTIPSDLSDGWHTLTGVCDTDELRLYLDGELFASEAHDASSVNGTDEPLQIAHNSEHGERV